VTTQRPENRCCESSCKLEAEIQDFDVQQTQGYSLATGAPKEPGKQDFLSMLLVIDNVEEARRLKWEAGVKEHRDGDASKPFNGDCVAEAYSEVLDLMSYWIVMHQEGLMGSELFVEGYKRIREIALMVRGVNRYPEGD